MHALAPLRTERAGQRDASGPAAVATATRVVPAWPSVSSRFMPVRGRDLQLAGARPGRAAGCAARWPPVRARAGAGARGLQAVDGGHGLVGAVHPGLRADGHGGAVRGERAQLVEIVAGWRTVGARPATSSVGPCSSSTIEVASRAVGDAGGVQRRERARRGARARAGSSDGRARRGAGERLVDHARGCRRWRARCAARAAGAAPPWRASARSQRRCAAPARSRSGREALEHHLAAERGVGRPARARAARRGQRPPIV